MSHNIPINEKKKALIAYKEKLLQDIKYYDKNIEEFRSIHKNNSYYEDADSSDPEDYFPNAIEAGPEVVQLKCQQTMLKTCLQATQELTGLSILQSEVNILVQDPQFERERPVTEPGTWREVTAECRIDLVPFTIVFYMHTPDRKFGQSSYRGLQVSMIKAAHETELQKSVLHTLVRPSDAVEVVRSYAAAYRSRRTTLARLANKYANSLFMEPHPEGGFVLKCANLLEILWRLENKWSPVAPFHHRMKFDLEYMDESYIKIITQAHKQLLDPAIQTDERTLLLSKIITTCLEARGPVDSESDLESRQTEIQTDIEPKDKNSEVMAPPKSLPKKTKKVAAKDKKDNKDIDVGKEKDMIKDKNTDKGNDLTKDKNANKDLTKDKQTKNVTKAKMTSTAAETAKTTNNDLVKEKNVNDVNKPKNANKHLTKDTNKDMAKAKAQKRVVDDENVVVNAKKMRTNEDVTKKSLKAKEKSGELKKGGNKKAENGNKEKEAVSAIKIGTNEDGLKKNLTTKEKSGEIQKSDNKKTENEQKEKDAVKQKPKGKENSGELNSNKKTKGNVIDSAASKSNKKAKDSIVDSEVTKKKLNENSSLPKKTISNDVFGQVNKKTKDTENINVESNKEINNIANEKGKQNNNTDATKIAKKRKNNENIQSDVAKTNIEGDKGPKKLKTNEETKEIDTQKCTTAAKIPKANENVNKNIKQSKSKENNLKSNTASTEIINNNHNINENKESNNEIAKVNNRKVKNDDEPRKKIDRKSKMSIANDKKFDLITKNVGNFLNKEGNTVSKNQPTKNPENDVNKPTNTTFIKESNTNVKNVANAKDLQESAKDNNIGKKNVPGTKSTEHKQNEIESTENKNVEKKKVTSSKITEPKLNMDMNPKPMDTVRKNNPGNTKDNQIVKKVTEKNANSIKNKERITNINKVSEKIVENKVITSNKPIKLIPSKEIPQENIKNKKLTKFTLKSVRNIHKSPTHKNPLKLNKINIPNSGNTKISTGNMFAGSTEKENGGKVVSKIPQKKMSPRTENILKKNMLRISPRSLPSKFKTITQSAKNMVKNTNIPRLLKNPAPRTS